MGATVWDMAVAFLVFIITGSRRTGRPGQCRRVVGGVFLMDGLYESIMLKAAGMDAASRGLIASVADRYVRQIEAIATMDPQAVNSFSKAVTAANNTVITLAKLLPDNTEDNEEEGRMADILQAIRSGPDRR